jgi:hypothetical protein
MFLSLEIFFRQLWVCYFVAPSLTRGQVCNLLYNCFWALPEQSLLGQVPQNSRPYFTVSSETPPTWSARSPYLYPPRNRLAQLYPRSWSFSCGRQSVDQFVWVSGLPLGPLTRFYLVLLSSSDNYFILLSKASSLTRKRVCRLQCNHSLVRFLTPNNHTLPSHLRLCSSFVAS